MSTEDRKDIIPFETICNNHNHVVHLLQQYKKDKRYLVRRPSD